MGAHRGVRSFCSVKERFRQLTPFVDQVEIAQQLRQRQNIFWKKVGQSFYQYQFEMGNGQPTTRGS